jgi:hypothetical protein
VNITYLKDLLCAPRRRHRWRRFDSITPSLIIEVFDACPAPADELCRRLSFLLLISPRRIRTRTDQSPHEGGRETSKARGIRIGRRAVHLSPSLKFATSSINAAIRRCRRSGTCTPAKYGLMTHCAARPDADALHWGSDVYVWPQAGAAVKAAANVKSPKPECASKPPSGSAIDNPTTFSWVFPASHKLLHVSQQHFGERPLSSS